MIALKARECIEVEPSFMADRISSGMYSPEELVDTELDILRTLGWRLNGPTPCDFIQHYLELHPPSSNKQLIRMLVFDAIKVSEAAVMDYSVALEPFSCIAIAAIKVCLADGRREEYEGLDVTDLLSFVSCETNASATNDTALFDE